MVKDKGSGKNGLTLYPMDEMGFYIAVLSGYSQRFRLLLQSLDTAPCADRNFYSRYPYVMVRTYIKPR